MKTGSGEWTDTALIPSPSYLEEFNANICLGKEEI